MKQSISILVTLAVLTNCGVFSHSKSMNVEDYTQWYLKKKPVLTTSQKVRDIQFELSYLPYEFQVGYALKQGDLTVAEARAMQNEFTLAHTFKLTLVLPTNGKDIYSYNLKNKLTKEQKMIYYLTDLKKDVLLVINSGDTLSCTNAMLEQGISNMNVATFLFDFNHVERNEIKELIFKDQLLTEQTVVFDLSTLNLSQVPKLSLKGYEK